MATGLTILFALELALLLTHEMDAIRHKEWRMFVFLKDLPEQTAYWVFTLPHILFYALILFFLLLNKTFILYIVDIFLIFHLVLHIVFKNHPNNQLSGFWSKWIIYMAGIIGALHLGLMLLL